MLLLNNLGSNTVLLSPTSSSRSINSESPHNLAISPDDKQDSKDNGGEDGRDTDTATWHSTTSTLKSPSNSTSTSVCEPRSKPHHTHRLSVSCKLTIKLSRAIPRVKSNNTAQSSSSSSSIFSCSSTSPLLTSLSAYQTSTPSLNSNPTPLPFRNTYDYSQGSRPLKLKLQFHPQGTSSPHWKEGRKARPYQTSPPTVPQQMRSD